MSTEPRHSERALKAAFEIWKREGCSTVNSVSQLAAIIDRETGVAELERQLYEKAALTKLGDGGEK